MDVCPSWYDSIAGTGGQREFAVFSTFSMGYEIKEPEPTAYY